MSAPKFRGPDLTDVGAIEAIRVIQELAEILWWDNEKERWDPEKQWDAGTIELVASTLNEAGIQPTQVMNTRLGRKMHRTRQVVIVGDVEHGKKTT